MDVVDHLIVGAGTAGCVLAARLSEDPDRRVLLLEAGPDFPDEAALPAALRDGDGEGYDWRLSAVICGDRTGEVPRGRVVGGSAQVNHRGALRAPTADFDAWAALGLPEWSWDRVLPSYCRIEADQEYGGEPYHGSDGPVAITRVPRDDLTAPMAGFLEAVVGSGHPYCADMNAPGAAGIGPYPQNRRGRTRISTNLAYLAPARGRPNLAVSGGVTVDRIVVRDGRAVGVEASGETIAAREVILAAGSPATPALLLRSGIGPADELRAVGVSPVIDVPGVGRNLYDQPGAVIPALPVPGTVTDESPINQLIARLDAVPGYPADHGFYLNLFTGPSPGGGQPMSAIMVGDLNRGSRGAITLRGADPTRPAWVDLNFYGAAGDIERMRSAYRHAWSIAQHPAFARVVTGFWMVDEATVADDERLDDLLRAMTFSRAALAGGAAMGPDGDPEAVVDEHCRVRGIDGLRAVDLAVVPVPLRAPTALDAMMLGEHVAPWIAAVKPPALPASVGRTSLGTPWP